MERKKLGLVLKIKTLISVGSAILSAISFILLMIFIFAFKNLTLQIIFSSTTIVFLTLTVILSCLNTLQNKKIFYDEILQRTDSNYSLISKGDEKNLDFYSEDKYKEINDLNESIDAINKNRAKFYFKKIDINDINQDYLEAFDDLNVIKEEDFLKNLNYYIQASNSYKDILFSIKFAKESDKEIPLDEKKKLVSLLRKTYKHNPLVVSYNETNNYFLCFMSLIDNLSTFKRKFDEINSDFIILDFKLGATLSYLRMSYVVYPYSGSRDLLTHLRYAERKGDSVSYYIPKDTDYFSHRHDFALKNRAEYGKLVDVLNHYRQENIKDKEYFDSINNILKSVSSILNYDMCGVATCDFDALSFTIRSNYLKEEYSKIEIDRYMLNEAISKEIIENVDLDGSYTFFDVEDCPHLLKRLFNKLGVVEGLIYVLLAGGKAVGIIYYLNFTKKEFLTNDKRDFILYYSLHVSTFVNEYNNSISIGFYRRNLSTLLLVTNNKQYTINAKTFHLIDYSISFPDIYPGIKIGDLCYKRLYGLNAPCEDCPLLSKKKKIMQIDGATYMYNMSQVRDKSALATFFLSPYGENKPSFFRNRFDPDLLINTIFSLKERLNNLFIEKSRGFILLIRVENADKIITQFSENTYNKFLIRASEKIRFIADYINNVYLYDSNVLAIVLNEVVRNEIFGIIEKIHDILERYIEKHKIDCGIYATVFAFTYPLMYDTVFDLFRSMNVTLNEEKARLDNKFIFKDENIIRPLSRSEYIFSLLDESFKKHSFELRILPLVKNSTKIIEGGEILLRLKDPLSNNYIGAYEFIDIAIKNKKINAFTNLIIEQIGKIYKQYAQVVFRTNFLERLTINLDSSYFKENEYFINDIARLIKEYNFNRNFLTFEINEKDVFDNEDIVKGAIKKLKAYDIDFALDQYNGKYLSVEKIKKCGFTEVKISRDIISDFDSSPVKAEALNELCKDLKKEELKVTVVGVERQDQVDLIKENEDIDTIQGYYYYKPLELNDFIQEIRQNSLK